MNSATDAELLTAATVELNKIRDKHKSMFFVPNIGQERFFNLYRDRRPYIGVFGAGNGTGKTASLCAMLVGLNFGADELDDYFQNHYFIQWANDRRNDLRRELRGRIVCNADSMKEGGAMLEAIRDWLPKGRYTMDKGGKTYYSKIVCDNGDTVDVKTHDQRETAHAGSNLDYILFDEPCPQAVYSESVGRTRNGGFMAFFLTPLDLSAWMMEQIIDDADGDDKCVVEASIWDNCIDIPGTRGHLSRDNINKMIREWERMNPEELDARIYGKFTHLSGSIWKIFSKSVHLINPFPIPRDWPITCIMDPHDVRPPAITWFADGPDMSVACAEWPTYEYHKVKTTETTTDGVAFEMRKTEAQWPGQVVYRYMDPNKINYSHPHKTTRMTVKQEFANRGFAFAPADDNLQVGHSRVNELLHYDIKRELSDYNRPWLYVFNDMVNGPNALQKYGIRRKMNPHATSLTAKLDQTYKDFADTYRYYASRRRKYAPVSGIGDMFSQIQAGRVKIM